MELKELINNKTDEVSKFSVESEEFSNGTKAIKTLADSYATVAAVETDMKKFEETQALEKAKGKREFWIGVGKVAAGVIGIGASAGLAWYEYHTTLAFDTLGSFRSESSKIARKVVDKTVSKLENLRNL